MSLLDRFNEKGDLSTFLMGLGLLGSKYQDQADVYKKSLLAAMEREKDRKFKARQAATKMQQNRDKYGLNPFITTDDQGNLYGYQLNTFGDMRAIDIPEGQRIAQKGSWKDTGAGYRFLSPYGFSPDIPSALTQNTDKPETFIPKDLAPTETPEYLEEKTAITQETKDKAKAAVDLETVYNSSASMLNALDSVINDEDAREFASGGTNILYGVAKNLPWTDSAGFEKKLKQLQGKTFLSAYDSLRGGGQITEIEGKKAEEAFARLNAAQSEEDFLQALLDAKTEVQNLVKLAEKKAGKNVRKSWNDLND